MSGLLASSSTTSGKPVNVSSRRTSRRATPLVVSASMGFTVQFAFLASTFGCSGCGEARKICKAAACFADNVGIGSGSSSSGTGSRNVISRVPACSRPRPGRLHSAPGPNHTDSSPPSSAPAQEIGREQHFFIDDLPDFFYSALRPDLAEPDAESGIGSIAFAEGCEQPFADSHAFAQVFGHRVGIGVIERPIENHLREQPRGGHGRRFRLTEQIGLRATIHDRLPGECSESLVSIPDCSGGMQSRFGPRISSSGRAGPRFAPPRLRVPRSTPAKHRPRRLLQALGIRESVGRLLFQATKNRRFDVCRNRGQPGPQGRHRFGEVRREQLAIIIVLEGRGR